ncbi:MAG: hypothetical protein IJ086_00780 [Clostridium sp.]|nr:hypothetical protein [Clostridium sp.]
MSKIIKVKDKDIKVFSVVPELNENQIKKTVNKQVRFLKAIYPWLEELETYSEGAMEIRPIKRDVINLKKDFKKSYNAWHMGEKDIAELEEFMLNITGKGYCIYYSAYAFDYHLDCYKEDGKKFKKGTVNKQNALFTTILPIDFDNMTYEEFAKEKAKLTALGIETIDIYSGHGFQSIILLEHKVYDTNLIGDFTKLLDSRGFKVDLSIVDCARILRLPYSFNCKALDQNQTEYYSEDNPMIYPTTDITWTNKRYEVQDIFNRIATMENLKDSYKGINLDEIKIKDIIIKSEAPTVTTVKKQREVKELKIKIENTKSKYPMINSFDALPDPVKKMLTNTPNGLRNQTIMFLVPFFRNTLGLNIQTIKQIMFVWGEHCSPRMSKEAVEIDVDRIYKKGFKGGFGKYTTELKKAYGYLEFNKYTRNNKIVIPNSLFEDFDVICDGAIKIYLAMKLANSLENIEEFTKEDIQKYADISERTVERNIKDLVGLGYICKRKENRRLGDKYIYYINPYFSSIEGYTMLENGIIELLMMKLTDGELKLYTYMCSMIGRSKGDCWASQKYLAKKIGKAGQSSISKMTDSMVEKKAINKITEIDDDNVKHCKYNLNY